MDKLFFNVTPSAAQKTNEKMNERIPEEEVKRGDREIATAEESQRQMAERLREQLESARREFKQLSQALLISRLKEPGRSG